MPSQRALGRKLGTLCIGLIAVAGVGVVATQVVGGGSSRGAGGSGQLAGGSGQITLPTTLDDFFHPGTQPNPDQEEFVPVAPSSNCTFCHANYVFEEPPGYSEPHNGWLNSLMAQSVRDPIWQAALTIANQDAEGAGEFCIRCHAPGAWLAGKSVTGDLSDFDMFDFDGINCHFCHRMVDPVYEEGISPPEDQAILAALDFAPNGHVGNAQFVIDPADVRRNARQVAVNYHSTVTGELAPIIFSPFHRESAACAACHDVSNPVYVRQPDGSYALGNLGEPHPTGDQHDMMPEQRTYSEWLFSDFASGGVFFPDGRFGGDHPTGVMQSCQDCHMPRRANFGGCAFTDSDPDLEPHADFAQHHFAGANTWVLGAVLDEYGFTTGLTEQSVADAHNRTAELLRNASDVELTVESDLLNVRVINWSGHKLPTGYPEGRRMWLNVRFLDEKGKLVQEHGAYDYRTATLDPSDTKVYEAKLGITDDVAQQVGLPAGKSFHLVLNNEVLFDNRIPPVGFTNAAYEEIRAAPVDYTYDDGQHWDDTAFPLPRGAAEAVVTLYYQTTTREYIEFLRDANVTNDRGQNAYDLWVAHGKSAPLDMNTVSIDLEQTPSVPGDLNDDGVVNVFDLLILLSEWGACVDENDCPADLNDDGVVNVIDLIFLLSNWG